MGIELFYYMGTGIFAGLMAGALGIGGGIIVVPVLLLIFSQDPTINPAIAYHLAIGSSLATMVFTALASVIAHGRLNNIQWPLYRHLAGGIIIGTILGVNLADVIPTFWLKSGLAFFLIIMALKMLFEKPMLLKPSRFPPLWVSRFISVLIGLKSGLLGIGGGALVIPYLHYCGVELRKITPISALCTLTVSFIGTILLIIIGRHAQGLPPYATGYVYWIAVLCIALPSSIFAHLGFKLNQILPADFLTYSFVCMLLITAFNLLL